MKENSFYSCQRNRKKNMISACGRVANVFGSCEAFKVCFPFIRSISHICQQNPHPESVDWPASSSSSSTSMPSIYFLFSHSENRNDFLRIGCDYHHPPASVGGGSGNSSSSFARSVTHNNEIENTHRTLSTVSARQSVENCVH